MGLLQKPRSLAEVTTLVDLQKLGAFKAVERKDLDQATRRHAMDHILQIIKRTPEPRAYLSERSHTSDEQVRFFWDHGLDILTRDLYEEGVSVIDPEFLRFLISWVPVFEQWANATDPFFRVIVTSDLVQDVLIPAENKATKHHTNTVEFAQVHGIRAIWWRPRRAPVSAR